VPIRGPLAEYASVTAGATRIVMSRASPNRDHMISLTEKISLRAVDCEKTSDESFAMTIALQGRGVRRAGVGRSREPRIEAG
jgi:hypothetical protein